MLLFVTASAPMTDSEEAFVQDELTEMLRRGEHLWVVPMRRHLPHANVAASNSGLSKRTIGHRLLEPVVIGGALLQFMRRPVAAVRVLCRVVVQAGGARNAATNLMSFPKALWLARLVRRKGISHIHSYWLAHTTTAAMVAGELAGCTWSASGFRWDIDANNCLSEKLRRACFIRVADEFGLRLIAARASDDGIEIPIELIRTGVAIPAADFTTRPLVREICCAGAFVEKKAQRIVVDAFASVYPTHSSARLHFFGDGELRHRVEQQVADLQLGHVVEFHGTVPLHELREYLQTRPITVLPSIVTAGGEQEGIAVVLIEAMANGSPVISTDTGAIAHLIAEGCGTLVVPGSASSLATAMSAALEQDAALADVQCVKAYERVMSEFSVTATAASLIARCSACVEGGPRPR
jgi:colanic acid/amylovoran biosynthesis glycosyltransferase